MTLFVGRSAQQLLTNGGNPVYLPPAGVPEAFRFLGHGTVAGIPVPLAVALLVIVGAWLVLSRTRFGRVVLATGIQASVVRYSGLRLPRITALTYAIVSTIAESPMSGLASASL